MIQTVFDIPFKSAITELNTLSARAFVLDEFIKDSKKRIQRDRAGIEPGTFMASGLAFRDMTLFGEVHNLFMPIRDYIISDDNLEEETDMILSRECLLHISQAYELLESFLYNVVSEFIRNNDSFHIFIEPNSSKTSLSAIRKALKTLDDRQNNRHLVRIIRANSKLFAEHEAKNIYNIDFKDWFEMLGIVRHLIVHSRMQIVDDPKHLPKGIERYFVRRLYKGGYYLFLGFRECSTALSHITAYVYLIYKSLVQTTYNVNTDFIQLSKLFDVLPKPEETEGPN